MKNFSLMFLLGLTALAMAACSSDDSSTGGTNKNTTINTTTASNTNTGNSNTAVMVNNNTANANGKVIDSTNTSTSGMTNTPEGFMTEAAKGGMAEVELSRVATTKSQNAEVKKFAQMMIQDHTNANTELKSLAGKKSVTLPTDLDPMHKTTKDKLSGLSGAEFDKEYVNAMVADHEKSVALFKTQSETGTDADAKAFAAKTLPKLQAHLDMIKGIQGKMK